MVFLAGAIIGMGSVHAQTADVDRFGIQKIYADAPPPANGWQFFIAATPGIPASMEQHSGGRSGRLVSPGRSGGS